MKKKGLLYIAIVFLMVSITGSIQAATVAPQTTAQLKAVLVKNNVNGIVVVGTPGLHPVVITHHQRTKGCPQISEKSPFPLASSTKILTGMAISRLIISKRFSNHSRIYSFFPHHRNLRRVTVQELMTHTSGIHDGLQFLPPVIMLKTQRAQAVFNFMRMRVRHPGTWQYSNVEYALLALIVSHTMRQPFQAVIQRQFITPTHVHLVAYNQVQASQLPTTNGIFGGQLNRWWVLNHMSQDLGAGEYLATPLQWWNFLTRIQRTDPAVLNQMQRTAQFTNNGYYGGAYWEGSFFHAEGYDDGYGSAYYVDRRTGKTLVVVTNNLTFRQLCDMKADLALVYFND